MTSRLRVTLLGDPIIKLDGSPLEDFTSKKSLALFCYLITTGRSHSREALSTLLWGESAQGRARASLRTVLWDLRQHLAGFVTADRQTVAFDRQAPYWLDVGEFSASLESVLGTREGEGDASSQLTDDDLRVLETALSLYQGEFMAGFYVSEAPTFEGWLLRKRERARQLAIQGWHRLVVHYTAARAYLNGIDAAAQLLEIAPWQEETHRQLMRLLALNGQRGAALAQYETCRKMLREELGVEPTMETRLLYNRIKTGKTLELPESPSPSTQSLHASPDSFGLPVQQGALVGRDTELAELKGLLTSLQSRLASLMGVGGVGKTRLAWEAAKQMAGEFEHGAWFVRLGGDGQQALSSSSEDPWELEAAGLPCPRPILTVARAFGLALTGTAPVETQLADYLCHKEALLVLDGYQPKRWDVSALENLLQSAPLMRLLVVSEGPLGNTSVENLSLDGLPVARSIGSGPAGEIAVEDAPWEGAAALFRERARRAAPDLEFNPRAARHVARLCQLTAGLPLAIELVAATMGRVQLEEAVRRLDHHTRALRGSGDRDGNHRAARAAAAYAWELLGSTQRSTLSKLSSFDEDFDEDAALEIVGVVPAKLRTMAARAWLYHLEAGRYVMHDTLRAFVRSKIGERTWDGDPEESNEAAEARQRFGAHYLGFVAARAGRLIGHGTRAACDDIRREWRNVRQAWLQAVADAQLDLLGESLGGLMRFLLLEGWLCEGESLLATTCRALQDVWGTSNHATLRAQFVTSRARLLNAQGRSDLAADVARQAVTEMPDGSEPDPPWSTLRAAGLVEWGRALHLQGEMARAKDRLNQALSLLSQDRSTEIRARALYHLGLVDLGDKACDRAQVHLTRALTLYESLEHYRGMSEAHTALGRVALRQRRYLAAETHFGKALNLAQSIGDRRGESIIYNNLGRLASAQGDHDRAAVRCEKALAIARALGDRHTETDVLRELGLLLLHQGKTEQAWKRSVLAVEIAHALGDTAREAQAWLVAGYVFSELNMLDQATHACQLSLELQRGIDHLDLVAESLACLARISLSRGDLSQARAYVDQVLDQPAVCARSGTDESLRVYLTCYQVLRACGDPRTEEVLRTVLSLYEETERDAPIPDV